MTGHNSRRSSGEDVWKFCTVFEALLQFKIIWEWKVNNNSLGPYRPSFSIFLQRKTPWKRCPHTLFLFHFPFALQKPSWILSLVAPKVANSWDLSKPHLMWPLRACDVADHSLLPETLWLLAYKTLQVLVLHLWLQLFIPTSQCWNFSDFCPGLLCSPAHSLPR